MSTPINDGGPAFPRVQQEDGNANVLVWAESGMSLRDYFIAHAPAEPQPWFQPVMPMPCQQKPAAPTDLTDQEKRDIEGWRADMYSLNDLTTERVRVYVQAFDAAVQAQNEWYRDFERETLLQWPGAWADEMLKRRLS